jgi:acetyl-CoA acetyltransferase
MTERAAIVGLGLVISAAGEVPSAQELALRALTRATEEAGLSIDDIDGMLLNRNELIAADHITLDLPRRLGLGELRVLIEVDAKGTTFPLALDLAARLVDSGKARAVAVLFADAAMQPGARAGGAFAAMGGGSGTRGLERAGGMLGAVSAYAFLTQHYFAATGAGERDLAAVAIAQRQWGVQNPDAWTHDPLSESAYYASPLVADPLRRLDCARPVSGATAVIVAAASARGSATHLPIEISGAAQRSTIRRRHSPGSLWEPTGARAAFDEALHDAGISRGDIDVLEIYDPFTVVPLILLEEFGFADRGTAGDLVRSGGTGMQGIIPTNTGGGQISGFYLQGVTPVVEAISQLRGTAGARQVAGARHAVVAAIGGRLEQHASIVLRAA